LHFWLWFPCVRAFWGVLCGPLPGGLERSLYRRGVVRFEALRNSSAMRLSVASTPASGHSARGTGPV
jgi:hypothetical protein